MSFNPDPDRRRPNPEEVTVQCTNDGCENQVLVHEDAAPAISAGEREAECLECRDA